MSEQIAWIAFLHTALFCAAWGYAKFLDQDWVYKAYSPDYVWLTVIGGDTLIWPFAAALYALGFPWWLNAIFYITLHCAAGIPIIKWQLGRKARRRREVEAL
jgi:hypothetical protein